MSGILELLTDQFRGDTISVVSFALGESPSRVQIAIRGALPALVGGLSSRASTPEGAADLIDLLRKEKIYATYRAGRALATPGGIDALIGTGKPLLDIILGDRSGPTIEWLSTYSGMKRSSSASLLGLAAPIVLGLIRTRMITTAWRVPDLMPLLGVTKTWLEVAPAGLAGILGIKPTERGSAAGRAPNAERSGAGTKFVLSIILLGVIGYTLLRKPPTDVVTSAPGHIEANLSGLAFESAGFSLDRTLPGGKTIQIPANSIEDKLLAVIRNPSSGIEQKRWFSFDQLEFEPDSAVLKSASAERIRNIAEIMKAYPRVNLRIRGHIDDSGNVANARLAENRATSIVNAFVLRGVDRTRFSIAGNDEQLQVTNGAIGRRQPDTQIDILITQM